MEKQRFNSNDLASDQWLVKLGDQVRKLRIRQNIDQNTLAQRAGIATSALRNLENGQGATMTTFVKTLQVLGKTDWLDTLAPIVSISPMQALRSRPERSRASHPRSKRARQ